MPQTDTRNCFATYLPSTIRIKKYFFLIYSLIPNIAKSQIGHLYQPCRFQSFQETLYNERHTQHETLIVLFQTFCKCIDSKIIHTEKKNTINLNNL